jgi:DNA mismatch endonuclease (patch repair protein)
MTDVLTKEQRSYNMSRIKSRDTGPEMIVRSMVHGMGYRYTLHSKNLPGTPDLIFKTRKRIIFVHGCFYHMHDCPNGRATPKTNIEFWETKRRANVTRDRRNLAALEKDGWRILFVWECMTKTKKREELKAMIAEFLSEQEIPKDYSRAANVARAKG